MRILSVLAFELLNMLMQFRSHILMQFRSQEAIVNNRTAV